MVNPELRDIAPHAVGIENGAKHSDDLRHPVAEPSLYAPEDLGIELLQTLFAGWGHLMVSRVGSAGSPMPPARAPEVDARGLREGQLHSHRCISSPFPTAI